MNNPGKLCSDISVLIPNDINSWSLKEEISEGNREYNTKIGFQDYMTLSISISDNTIEIIHIKGLLNKLFELDFFNKDDMNKLFQYSESNKHSIYGYNDDNILCALKESKEFCDKFVTSIETPIV